MKWFDITQQQSYDAQSAGAVGYTVCTSAEG